MTGLRGIAALWVFAYHCFRLTEDLPLIYRLPLAVFAKAGYLGVDIFFVLSGFVIAYNYSGIRRSAYLPYLWKRLARIYPLHIAALLFFGLTLPWNGFTTDISVGALMKSLLMVHAWALPVAKIWNSPSWSISAEWAAYLAFPLISFAAGRVKAYAIPAILVLFALFFCLVEFGPWPGDSMAYGMHRIAFEFTAGVLLFRVWVQTRLAMNFATLTALGGLIVGASIVESISRDDYAMSVLPIFACVIVYGLACSTGKLAAFMNRLRYLGLISYALYLFHATVLGILLQIVRGAGLSGNPAIVFPMLIAGLLLSLATAHLAHKYIENPCRKSMLEKQPGFRAGRQSVT